MHWTCDSVILAFVFELHDVSLLVATKPHERVLLGDVTAAFSAGELVAVVGPSESGKSTLLKLLAGVCRPTFGEVVWAEGTRPSIAYIPQLPPHSDGESRFFTATEQVETALSLRVGGLSPADRKEKAAALLEKTGLTKVADLRPDALTPIQQRRLALAVELTGSPAVLLCDEVSGAFDPKAELEFAKLLRKLAQEESRTIFHVTHALETLSVYDTVIVLHGGQLAYDCPPEFLAYYFQLKTTPDLYEQLAARKPDDWHRSWAKHRRLYQSAEGQVQMSTEIATEEYRRFLDKRRETESSEIKPAHAAAAQPHPGALSQFFTLLARRWKVARRDTPAFWRHLALMLGFPSLVVIFAANDMSWLRELSAKLTGNVVELLKEDAVFAVQASHGSWLIAGLAMAQIILLGFLAANNAAREVAGERMAFEKEKYNGLSPVAYVASKAAFLLPLVVVQSAWMGLYVSWVCELPGHFASQIGVLTLTNAALTALSLAISSFTRSPWRALLLSFCLAALQLPFSGTVLAPPDVLNWMIRPLVTLYWGASAYLQTMQGTRFYEVLQVVSPLALSPMFLCVFVLLSHVVLGVLLTLTGCKIDRLGLTRKNTHSGT